MANENLDEWKLSPATVNETVLAAKEFLDDELAKSSSYITLDSSINRYIEKHNYDAVKSKGVGRTVLVKFLGGNWKQWVIQEALSTLTRVRSDLSAISC